MGEEKDKWLSVGNDEFSTMDNRIETDRSSRSKSFNRLPIDKNGNPVFIDLGQRGIFGLYDRKMVKTIEYPYNCIALLKIQHEDGDILGTGFFISERCVVTAGHCVFSNGKWAKSIKVIPCANVEGYPAHWKESVSEKLRSVKGWVKDGDSEYDCGAIILPETLHNCTLGTMGYAEYSPELAKDVELSGYPDDKLEKQYYATGKIERVAANRLYHKLDTETGQSGSPVFIREGDKCVAVGIHSGTNSGIENYAIRVNGDVMRRWQEWSNI